MDVKEKHRNELIATLHEICEDCGRKPSIPGYCYKCWRDMVHVIVDGNPLELTFNMEDN